MRSGAIAVLGGSIVLGFAGAAAAQAADAPADPRAAAAEASAQAVAAAGPRWRDCGDVGFEEASDFGAFDVRAKRVRCRTAWRVAAGSKEMNVVEGPFRYRIGGFRCKGTPHDVGLPTVAWVCKRKRARVRFVRS